MIKRILSVVLLVLLGLSLSPVFAQGVQPALRRYAANPDNTIVRYFNTPLEYCTARMKYSNPTWTAICPADPAGSNQVAKSSGTEGPATSYLWYYGGCISKSGTTYNGCGTLNYVTPQRYCADGSATLTGPVANEKYCAVVEPKKCDDKNPFIRRFNYGLASGPFSSPDHYGECVVEPVEMLVCRKDVATGHSYCMWMVKRTGVPYDGPVDPITGGEDKPEVKTEPPVVSPPIKPPPGSQSKCPAGTVQAGVSSDGVAICMGSGTAPKNAPPPPPKLESEKTVSNADGSTTTTKTTVTTNADGSKTTSIETTNTAPTGEKTTSVAKDTSAAASGGAGKDDSNSEDEKYDLCKQNPTLTMCRNSSVAGACEEITCTGDAIQCATLRAAAAMECRDKKNEEDLAASPLVTAGERILSGADTTAADFSKGSVVDMSKQNLDQSGFVAGSCLANRSFTVSGHTVQVSFAQVCDKIQPLRAVVMACAFIISYLIVSRSVIQG